MFLSEHLNTRSGPQLFTSPSGRAGRGQKALALHLALLSARAPAPRSPRGTWVTYPLTMQLGLSQRSWQPLAQHPKSFLKSRTIATSQMPLQKHGPSGGEPRGWGRQRVHRRSSWISDEQWMIFQGRMSCSTPVLTEGCLV